MKTNAIIYNMSRGENLSQKSLIELFKKMSGEEFQSKIGIRTIKDYEHGIKINLYYYNNYFNDHTLDMEWETEEQAELYLFDNGEIFYVHKGQKSRDIEIGDDYPLLYMTSDYPDVSDITDELDKKLGKEYTLRKIIKNKNSFVQLMSDIFINSNIEELNDKKEKIIKERRKKIIKMVKESIKEGTYKETVYNHNSKTNEYVMWSEKDLPFKSIIKWLESGALLIPDFEWCRKGKYNVQIELGCYKIDEEHPLQEGFIEEEFDGVKYAIKKGFNILEQNNWETSPNRPYVITGTANERWSVKESNLSAYDVNIEDIGIEPVTVSTKDSKDQEFLVSCKIPSDIVLKVIPKWAYRADGTIDETQVMVANSATSKLPHESGDFVVAKHIDGEPEYMELSEDNRNTKEAASKYDPRVINCTIMERTYDHASTQDEIKNKYKSKKVLKLEE